MQAIMAAAIAVDAFYALIRTLSEHFTSNPMVLLTCDKT